MKEFFFGVNPLAILGLVFAIVMLVVGFSSPDVPGLLKWLATIVVILCIAGMKSLVDRDARRFQEPMDKAVKLEQILSGGIGTGENKKWNQVKRVFGGCLIAFAFVGAPTLFAGVSLALLLATGFSAIAFGYELLIRPE